MANMLHRRLAVRHKVGAHPKRRWSPRAALIFAGLVSLTLWALLIGAVIFWMRG